MCFVGTMVYISLIRLRNLLSKALTATKLKASSKKLRLGAAKGMSGSNMDFSQNIFYLANSFSTLIASIAEE